MNGDRLARYGALTGLAMGLAYAVWLVIVQSRPGRAGSVPALALGLGYVAPFLTSLAALRVHDAGRRAALWLGCGVLGLVLSFTSLAGVTLPLLVPAGLLLVGGARGLRSGARSPHGTDTGVLLGIVALGTASVIIVRVWADGFGAALAVTGWAVVGAWLAAMLSMDRRRRLGVRP